jgi:hypothetical protein
MDWTRTHRAAVLAAITGLIAIAATAATPAVAGTGTGTAPPSATAAAKRLSSHTPRPPHLPGDFRGTGKWVVRDLGITVPFTWRGRNGNSQMVAGGPRYPIWFTNLIYHNTLYTLTYKWPGVTEHPCSRIPGFFNLHLLNQTFKTARFVGREILQRNPRRHVNHWRVGVVLPQLPPGNHWRLGFALGDIYVDQHSRSTFWQVLQFGVQNLYDPELDEWMRMDTFQHRPGRVTLPGRCPPPA